MKLYLPNGKRIKLDTSLTLDEKIKIVEEITSEWEDYFLLYWDSEKVRVCLEVLANYLVWHKEKEEWKKEDKYVMSVLKMKRQKRGHEKEVLFSELNMKKKIEYGIEHCYNDDPEDDKMIESEDKQRRQIYAKRKKRLLK